jgi:2-succinyl-5-enolpyruvyl-6-hydroxy-3-cyclohexene-1-carboxylate synthase
MNGAQTVRPEPPPPNRNSVWVDTILAELHAAGVRKAVVCPGGRSVALVTGFARAGIDIVHVATDERSAGFFALGLAKACGAPVAVCVTSGSAVANLLPALTEAEPLRLPLVVLSADRPGGHGGGMPQTTDQIGLCRPAVRGSLALGDPDVTTATLGLLQSQMRDFLLQLGEGGPLHLNIPLHGVFTSADADPGWSPPQRPDAPASPPAPFRRTRQAVDWDDLRARLKLRRGLRGLIVVGHDPVLSRAQIERLAGALRFPILADAASGLRRPAVTDLVSEADALVLRQSLQAAPPELVLRLGPAPLSLTMQRFLGATAASSLCIAHSGSRDFLARGAPTLLESDDTDLDELIALLGPGDEAWRELWHNESVACRTRFERQVETLPWGECLAAHMVCAAAGYPLLHIANSMSARHANLYIGPGDRLQRIMMNRGVNGIDGTVSTFLGELAGANVPGLLLIGDQSMVHDMNGLEAARVHGVTGTICIMNNEGGSLFDLFGLNQLPDHGRLIRNPPGVNFEAVAAAFALPYRRCAGIEPLREALAEEPAQEQVRLVEMVVPPGSLLRDIEPLYRAAAGLG